MCSRDTAVRHRIAADVHILLFEKARVQLLTEGLVHRCFTVCCLLTDGGGRRHRGLLANTERHRVVEAI